MRYCGIVEERGCETDAGTTMFNYLMRYGNIKGNSGVIEPQKRRIYGDEVELAINNASYRLRHLVY